ncbi:MAG: thiamine-phosphate kinase [Betaproteobacteria bacterium]|nr:MAG: thiamine-phosphate kinase [Betaproteobacteria bacterium]
MPTEFELISRYFTHATPRTLLGVGDDAALVKAGSGMVLAVAADMLVGGRHFFSDADPQSVGHKALAVNLSDMAAMGATPRWATLGIALPEVDTRWLAAFTRGFMALARKHGVDLIGGDTTRGPLNICVQIIGEVPARRALRRDGAKAGDDIWVSGTLGDAALAVAARNRRIRLKPAERAQALRRLDWPAPRIALGMALRGVARSVIDVSDGLVADLGHICERSRVAAVVAVERLPVSALLRRHLASPVAQAAALAGGDDYELCFTAAPAKRAAVERAAGRAGLRVTRIGRVIRAPQGACSVVVVDRDGLPLPLAQRGFDHFG